MYEIREFRIEDISSIGEIEREAFGSHAWSENLFLSELTDETKYYLTIYEGETLIAYGGFQHVFDEAHIMNIAVKAEYRGKGYGGIMLDALLELQESLDVRATTLEVNAKNARAIELYLSRGFESAGTRPNYYGMHEDALIFWKYF